MREQPLDDEPWVKGAFVDKEGFSKSQGVCLYEFVCVCVPFFNAYI